MSFYDIDGATCTFGGTNIAPSGGYVSASVETSVETSRFKTTTTRPYGILWSTGKNATGSVTCPIDSATAQLDAGDEGTIVLTIPDVWQFSAPVMITSVSDEHDASSTDPQTYSFNFEATGAYTKTNSPS